MDYGLWLLIGLLVVIGIVFLLSGKGKADRAAPPAATVDTPSFRVAEPVAAPLADPALVAATPVEPATATPALEPIPTSPSVTPAPVGEDDLLRLKGVGPKLKALLIELGVTRYAQIAAWTDTDIAAIDARLGNFKGRPVRDQWVDQARYLAADDIAGFEAKYGKL